MWDNGATYGAKLQDLKYKATRAASTPAFGLTRACSLSSFVARAYTKM